MTASLNPTEPLERIIARVIRDVLRERRAPGPSPAARPAAASPAAGGPSSGALCLPDAVLSLASLEGRLDESIRRVTIGSGAVVTPAVRDELRARGIELVRVAGGLGGLASPTEPKRAARPDGNAGMSRLLADVDREDRTAGLAHQLRLRGIPAPHVTDLGTAVARLRDAEARAVVLAGLPQPVVCDACRHPHVRAAGVRMPSDVARLARAMHPNLWVLDMESLNFAAAVATAAACFRVSSHPQPRH